MKLFDPNPQILEGIDGALLSELRLGFIMYSPSSNGLRVWASVTPLPDGNHCMKCHIFDFKGNDEHGVEWREMRELGFITAEGFRRLSKHTHEGCPTRLELHLASDE